MFRTGNVFKLNDRLWIVSKVDQDHVSAIDFSHSNCSGAFPMHSKPYARTFECCDDDECSQCSGMGSYEEEAMRSGMDKAELLAECVEDYIIQCLLNPFDFKLRRG